MKKYTLICAMVMVAATFVLGGCFRKHIVSSPPAQKPAARKVVQPEEPKAPVEEKESVKKQPGPIEDTYVVEGPAEPEAPVAEVQEGDLDDEPLATPEQTGNTPAEAAPESKAGIADTDKSEVVEEVATAVVIETSESDTAAKPEAKVEEQSEVVVEETVVNEPAATAETAAGVETYYVQIGAFGDLENANRALARLLSDGYKGSRLSKTDNGLFRVQAGAFPDEVSAEEALSKLLADYPKGFVLKTD